MNELNSNLTPNPPNSPSADNAVDSRRVDGGQGWNWIAQGWDLFKKSPGIWIANILIFCGLYIVLQMVPIVGAIAVHVLWPVMMGGLMLGCRALERNEKLEFAHLFAGFNTNTSQLIMVGVFATIAGLLIGGIVVLVIFLAGGGTLIAAALGGTVAALLAGGAFLIMALFGILLAALLAVPLMMALWFAPALVVFRNAQAMHAMRLSFSACLENLMPFLIYSFATFVLAIVASIPAFLGWLVLLPVLVASIYTGYRDLFPET